MAGGALPAWLARLARAAAVLLYVLAGTALVLLMLIGFGDVFARYFFAASIVQREELFNVLLIVLFVSSFALITIQREHLDVDLLDFLFKTPFRRQLQFLLIDLSVAVSCIVMSYWMYDKAGRISRPGREVMYEELGLQQGWFAYAFAAVLLVVGVIMLIWAVWYVYAMVAHREDVVPEISHKDNL